VRQPDSLELIAAGHADPQSHRVYRCAVCRLDLVLSTDERRMVNTRVERRSARRVELER
jgi:hypothetical protein